MSEAEVKRQDIKFTPHIIWTELGLCSVVVVKRDCRLIDIIDGIKENVKHVTRLNDKNKVGSYLWIRHFASWQ